MFLLILTLSSQRIPSCDSSTSLWETYRHEEGLGSDYVSNYDGKHLHMAAVASSGHPLAWAAPLKCSIWLHIFINKHRQWWFPFPESLARILHDLRYRLEIHPQMEPVYINQTHIHVCRRHQTQLLRLTQTLENANTATPDLGYHNKFL